MPSSIDTFRQTHIYDADATAADIIQDLHAIGGTCQTLDRWRRFYMKIFLIAIVPAILSVPIGIHFIDDSTAIVLSVMTICIGVSVIGAIGWAIYGGRSFEPKLGGMVQRTLDLVSRDMAPNAKLKLHLDLRSHEHPSKLKRTAKVREWTVKYYNDPWLRLTGRLLDGSAFRLMAIYHLQKRHKYKKSRSGKTKMKTKSKNSTVMSLRVKFKPKRYPHIAQFKDSPAAAQMPPLVELRKMKTTANSAYMSVRLPTWENTPPGGKPTVVVSGPHTAAMMFLSVYQVLNLSRTLVKQGKAGNGQ